MEKDGADAASGENTRVQQARRARPRTCLFTAARWLYFPLCPTTSAPRTRRLRRRHQTNFLSEIGLAFTA